MHVRTLSTKASDLPIRGIMVTHVACVRPDESLNRAARIMSERDCGCVVVVDREGGVVGILTDRDITLAAFEDSASLREIRVSNAMTRHPLTIRAEETIGEAMRLMRSQQVRRLPVVDSAHRLTGLLTLGDIVKVTAATRRRGDDPSASDALVETFAAIGERRSDSVTSLVCPT